MQVDRAAFHETVAAERARELLAREKELQEARLREAALEQHIRQLEQEVGAVRDAARAVRREEADQSQVVEGLQQQLEQMQLLALSQSREAETAMGICRCEEGSWRSRRVDMSVLTFAAPRSAP